MTSLSPFTCACAQCGRSKDGLQRGRSGSNGVARRGWERERDAGYLGSHPITLLEDGKDCNIARMLSRRGAGRYITRFRCQSASWSLNPPHRWYLCHGRVRQCHNAINRKLMCIVQQEREQAYGLLRVSRLQASSLALSPLKPDSSVGGFVYQAVGTRQSKPQCRPHPLRIP